MPAEANTSTSARILYRPVGITSGILGGLIAGQVFKLVWKKASPADAADAPQALESEYAMRQIILAAALQGAIFATVKVVIDRGGARIFQRLTGEWPGD